MCLRSFVQRQRNASRLILLRLIAGLVVVACINITVTAEADQPEVKPADDAKLIPTLFLSTPTIRGLAIAVPSIRTRNLKRRIWINWRKKASRLLMVTARHRFARRRGMGC